MQVKDEDLIRFCLHMKNKRRSLEDSRFRNEDLYIRLFDSMNGFIRTDEKLKNLTDSEKESLYSVFVSFTPEHKYYNSSRKSSYYDVRYDPYPIYTPYWFFWGAAGANNTSRTSDGKDLVIVFAIFLAISALVASLKTILEIINNVESISYNEGKDRALFNLAAITTIYSVTTYIAITFLFTALVSNNPYYLSAIITTSVVILFSYGLYCLVDLIANNFSPINPSNPYEKFTMTPKEAEMLDQEGIDPLKARAAIVLLNSEISSENPAKRTICRMFVNENINTIRNIRKGLIKEVVINENNINIEKNPVVTDAIFANEPVYTDDIRVCPFVEEQEYVPVQASML